MRLCGNGTTARFSVLLYCFWASVVSMEVFLVPYLVEHGFSTAQAGYVMSTVFLLTVFSQPAWGYVCDRTGRHREIIVVALLAGAVAMLLIPAAGTAFAVVALLAALYSISANSMPGILDSWIMKWRASHGGVEYGVARGVGSLGFALTSVVMGRLYDTLGLALNFPIYAVCAAAAVLATLSIRALDPAEAKPRRNDGRTALLSAAGQSGIVAMGRSIVGNRDYLFFLIAALGIITALRAAMTFLPLLIYSVGGTNVHVGLAQFASAGSEIPFMFAAAMLLRRFRPHSLLLAAMAVFVLRIGLLSLAPTAAAIVAVQVLHGASFGLFLPTSVYFIDRISPAQFKTAYQSLAPSVYFGIGSVIGSSSGGLVVEYLGLNALYRVAPVLVALSVLLFGYAVVTARSRL
ncbi:MAG: MFS transporter [Spirochaetaceae bacterium]|nr:MAG: MFS transporter [Spirochaetaceae bacterium]